MQAEVSHISRLALHAQLSRRTFYYHVCSHGYYRTGQRRLSGGERSRHRGLMSTGRAIASASHAEDSRSYGRRTVDGVAAPALRAAPVLADLYLAVQSAVVGRRREESEAGQQYSGCNAGRQPWSSKGKDALVRVDGEASASDNALSVEREDFDRVLWRSHVRDLPVGIVGVWDNTG